jgi:hypothetical protein
MPTPVREYPASSKSNFDREKLSFYNTAYLNRSDQYRYLKCTLGPKDELSEEKLKHRDVSGICAWPKCLNSASSYSYTLLESPASMNNPDHPLLIRIRLVDIQPPRGFSISTELRGRNFGQDSNIAPAGGGVKQGMYLHDAIRSLVYNTLQHGCWTRNVTQ